MKIRFYLAIFLITFLIGIHSVAEARGGGRGGGARGGSRSGSRSSSSRSRSSSSTSRSTVSYKSRSTYYGPSYRSGSWKTAAALGTLWGLSSYTRRRLYHSHPNREPTICFNENNLKNGTYGYFICPQEGEPDDHDSCCGDVDAQYCCPFLMTPGAIAGIVIGVLVACGLIFLLVFCCIKKRHKLSKMIKGSDRNRGSEPMSSYNNSKTFATPYSESPVGPPAYSYPQPAEKSSATAPYPPADHVTSSDQPPPIGFTDSKEPAPTGNGEYSYAYNTHPYHPDSSAPSYTASGYTQPEGAYSTPPVQPPPYSEKN